MQMKAVSAVACTDDRVCAAKGACMAAIEPTVQALDLKDEVTRRLADIEAKRAEPDEAKALPAKLDEATRLLTIGRTKMSDCDRALADLQVSFRL